jgi:hypothetical protein
LDFARIAIPGLGDLLEMNRLKYVSLLSVFALASAPLALRAQDGYPAPPPPPHSDVHYGYFHDHGASLAVGATGQFSTILEQNDSRTTYTTTVGGAPITNTVFNHHQDTTDSTGLLATFDVHPRPWAGVEFNYGFTHYSERFSYQNANVTTPGRVSVPVDWHEATGAYQFHPRHIPFQPFVNIGGGAIDFVPGNGQNQWRGAGLVEAGFDLPIKYKHVGFRVEGRSLIYRSPNFNQPLISTRSWRATTQPALSAFYRF